MGEDIKYLYCIDNYGTDLDRGGFYTGYRIENFDKYRIGNFYGYYTWRFIEVPRYMYDIATMGERPCSLKY